MPFNKKQWTSNLHDDAVNAIFAYLDAVAPGLPRDEKMKVAFHGMVYTVANLKVRSHSLPTKDEVEGTSGPQEAIGRGFKAKYNAECFECGSKFETTSTTPTCPSCKGYHTRLIESIGPKESLGLDIDATIKEIFGNDEENFYSPEVSAHYDDEGPDYDDQRGIGASEIQGEAISDLKDQIVADAIEYANQIYPDHNFGRAEVTDIVDDVLDRFDVRDTESLTDDDRADMEQRVEREFFGPADFEEAADTDDLNTDRVLADALHEEGGIVELFEDDDDTLPLPKLPGVASSGRPEREHKWTMALDLAARSAPGVGWTVPPDWAESIVKNYNLKLDQDRGDMTGEVSALFDYKGKTLRLKKVFPNSWKIYLGAWKPDPHWTED